jgi:hypothetical protein
VNRGCRALNLRGEPCGQRPIQDSDLCFWHHPDYEKQAADARRAGGMNHAREQTLKAVFDIAGVDTVEDAQRVAEIALTGLLALDNSVARSRALLSVATTIATLIQVGDLARKVDELKAVVDRRPKPDQEKRRRPWRWGDR